MGFNIARSIDRAFLELCSQKDSKMVKINTKHKVMNITKNEAMIKYYLLTINTYETQRKKTVIGNFCRKYH